MIITENNIQISLLLARFHDWDMTENESGSVFGGPVTLSWFLSDI
jgi:hypothetical protein